MNNRKTIAILTGILLSAAGTAQVQAQSDPERTFRSTMMFLVNGIRDSYPCDIPMTDEGTTTATCHDHEVIDLKTNRIIGTATDATADVVEVDGGLVGTGTTTFRLDSGTFVVRGRGSIQPVLHGSPTQSGWPVTNIAGIFPENGENNVLSEHGTGRYRDAEGTFTLLGALDMTNSASGQGAYHCVYFIYLERDGRPIVAR